MTQTPTTKAGALTKKDIAIKAAEKAGVKQQAALSVVESVLETITESLVSGRRVELRGFGSFNIRTNKPRKGRNPKNPTVEVLIPETTVVKFKASKDWKPGKPA